MPNMARPRCHGRPTSRASELLQFGLSFTETPSIGENNQGARNVAGSVAYSSASSLAFEIMCFS